MRCTSAVLLSLHQTWLCATFAPKCTQQDHLQEWHGVVHSV